MEPVIFYHATSVENAKRIVAGGFEDRAGVLAERAGLGVWLSDLILSCNSGTKGDTVFEVTLKDDVDLTEYDWTVEDSPHQEFCVPAAVVNAGEIRLLSEEEEAETVSRQSRQFWEKHTRYVGLTDDPERRKQKHGNPSNWSQQRFETEKVARAWEKSQLSDGWTRDTDGTRWRYGYAFTK